MNTLCQELFLNALLQPRTLAQARMHIQMFEIRHAYSNVSILDTNRELTNRLELTYIYSFEIQFLPVVFSLRLHKGKE